jgi:hypothetical protein
MDKDELARRYPRWLNIASAAALSVCAIGFILALFRLRTGFGLLAIGSLGIWITGTIAERPALRARSPGRGDHG